MNVYTFRIRWSLHVFILLLLMFSPQVGRAESDPSEDPKAPGVGRRILNYIPNRALDLLDVARLRLRVGPGLSFDARATDYLSLSMGSYRSAYAGLPGPRYPERFRPPYGWEERRGLMVCGVNALDDAKNPPDYSLSEFDLGAHLLLVGGVVGFDPVEFGDFIAGFIFRDPRGDDLETARPAYPYERIEGWDNMLSPKPEQFERFQDRLDYVHDNLVWQMNTGTEMIDGLLLNESDLRKDTPASRLRLGVYVEGEYKEGVDVSFDGDFDMEVDLPNLEERWNVFLTGRNNDELPSTNPSERESGMLMGVTRPLNRFGIAPEAGIKLRWLPELFAAVKWSPKVKRWAWTFFPRVRVYIESDDGIGQVTSFTARNWFGREKRGMFNSVSAFRYEENDDELDWEQTFLLAHVSRLTDEERRGHTADRTDAAWALGVRASVFGTFDVEEDVDRYRLTIPYRRPLYGDWINLEIAPELEWEAEDDWETVYKLRVGVDLLFWGANWKPTR